MCLSALRWWYMCWESSSEELDREYERKRYRGWKTISGIFCVVHCNQVRLEFLKGISLIKRSRRKSICWHIRIGNPGKFVVEEKKKAGTSKSAGCDYKGNAGSICSK